MEDNIEFKAESSPQDQPIPVSEEAPLSQITIPQDPSEANTAARDQALLQQAKLVERQRRARVAAGIEVEDIIEGPTATEAREDGIPDQVDAQAELQSETEGGGDRQDSRAQSRFEEALLPSGGSVQPENFIHSTDDDMRKAASDLLNIRNGRLQVPEAEPPQRVIDLTALEDDAEDVVQPARPRQYRSHSVLSLQILCKERGLGTTGTKALLTERLQADDKGRPRPATRASREQQAATQRTLAGMTPAQFRTLRQQEMLIQQHASATRSHSADQLPLTAEQMQHNANQLQQQQWQQEMVLAQTQGNPAMVQALQSRQQAIVRQQHAFAVMRRPAPRRAHNVPNAQPEQPGQQPLWPNGEIMTQERHQRHLAPGYWREQNRLAGLPAAQSQRGPIPPPQAYPAFQDLPARQGGRQGPRPISPTLQVRPTFPDRAPLPAPLRSIDSRPPNYPYYGRLPTSFGALELARNGSGYPQHELMRVQMDDRLKNQLDRWQKRYLTKWYSLGVLKKPYQANLPDVELDEDDADADDAGEDSENVDAEMLSE